MADTVQKEQKHITLSAFAEQIRLAIESGVGGEQWVVAEVSSIQVNYSGHCYLELTEKVDGQQSSRAVCRAVIWGNRYKMIASYFKHETGSDIKQGMKLLVRCSASYHPVYGLSLVISDINPTYTVGEVERVRHQTIARLQADGTFEMNRELELPVVIQRIAIISSSGAAGYGDFCRELEKSGFRFETTLFQAIMQGDGAEQSVISALENIAEHDFDAIVIIRGGGSVNDLSCFDSYLLCSNIAQFPMPVITGIGHDRDVSVADMVACLSLKTPTAVATHMIELAANYMSRIESDESHIVRMAQNVLVNESRNLDNLSLHVQQIVKQSIYDNSTKISEFESALKLVGSMFLREKTHLCESVEKWILQKAQSEIVRHKEAHSTILQQIADATNRILAAEQHKLDIFTLSVEAVNPRRILSMGYAIVNNGLRSLDEVQPGDELSVELADGVIIANVKDKWKKNR